MRRFLSITVTLLCAILLAATLFLWFRSYSQIDTWTWGGWSNDADSDRDRQTIVREERGWITSGRGTLSAWRRKQQITLSLAAAHNLLNGNEFKGPEHEAQQPSEGNEYGKPTGDTFWNHLGFHYAHHVGRDPNTHYYELAIPFRALAALFAIPLLIQLGRLLFRRSRRSPHACPACGYDLRATPGRCPECGFVPPPAPLYELDP